ncbi:MAG: hypothetical protein ILP09_07360 [Oscillospiraceae bacterium]|nr:hypothetical protein [Oscillospiraceae bacterium]
MTKEYIYPKSVRECAEGKAYIKRASDGTETFVCGSRTLPLNAEAAEIMRSQFAFCRPSRVLAHPRSFGLGDRLGIAGSGQLSCFEGLDVLPVAAQQSVRELTLTGRSFEQVLDAATFAVFREGREGPWGADGDHLKTFDEIDRAVKAGYTMLTLDCSEMIGRGAPPDDERKKRYTAKSFETEGISFVYDSDSLDAICRTYSAAIDHICAVYEKYIKNGNMDFEISIDETSDTTTPQAHFFVANELRLRGVRFETMAPRFCGEFQKGIDYIGDPRLFEADIAAHAAIARKFGYKLSIHSGSDKLSIYPIIAGQTKGHYHVKTAGTSWLEAMKLTAMKAPGLYRRAHALALASFAEALKYYHVSARPDAVPDPESMSDKSLPELFENDAARQLIHITYGQILNSGLREELFALWTECREDYNELLGEHIGRHLSLLGLEKGK